MFKSRLFASALFVSFVSVSAHAGWWERVRGSCVSFLKKSPLDQKLIRDKFYPPHQAWLERFVARGQAEYFDVEVNSSEDYQAVASLVAKHSQTVVTVNSRQSGGWATILLLTPTQLNSLLAENVIARASFVVEVPDPSVFHHLKQIPKPSLEKMSQEVLTQVLITDPALSDRILTDLIKIEFAVPPAGALAVLSINKVDVQFASSMSAYVRISIDQLIQVLSSPLILKVTVFKGATRELL